jgi:hypothetical protein
MEVPKALLRQPRDPYGTHMTGHFVELAKRVGMQKVEFRHFDS